MYTGGMDRTCYLPEYENHAALEANWPGQMAQGAGEPCSRILSVKKLILIYICICIDVHWGGWTVHATSLSLEIMQPLKPIGLDKWRRVLVSPAAESCLLKN